MRRFKWWVGIPAVVVTVAALTYGLSAPGSASTAPTPAATPVRVMTIHWQSVQPTDRLAAVLRPRIEADLGFRVSGKIQRRLVDVGARVTAGQVLATLDPADLELQRRSAEAQLASAQADAANAAADFERYARLKHADWTTQQEYDRRQATAVTTAARVKQMAAELAVARNNAGYANLVADGDGVVTQINAEPGQVVAAGQTVLKLAHSGEIEAVANVPEQTVGHLASARLAVELWSMPGRRINGHVREIAPSADPTTRTYQVKITLEDPPPTAQLGMTATLIAESADPTRVVLVPAGAITKDGTTPAVWALGPTGDRLVLKPVTVAAWTGEGAVLADGLAEGDRIVTAGVHKLDAGLAVRVWQEPER